MFDLSCYDDYRVLGATHPSAWLGFGTIRKITGQKDGMICQNIIHKENHTP